MPLRTRLFIILSAIALVVLAVSIYLTIRANNKAEQQQTPATQQQNQIILPDGSVSQQPSIQAPQAGVATSIPNTYLKPMTTQQAEENAAKQIAKTFVERYGSYSSQNDYQNIKDVESLVSGRLWSELSKRMTGAQSNEFSRVITKVISANLTDLGSEQYSVDIQTIRDEERAGVQSNYQQEATATVIKSSGSWVVGSFEWK
ncbi:MAG: hypothetical protein ABH832_01980 [bacterium]